MTLIVAFKYTTQKSSYIGRQRYSQKQARQQKQESRNNNGEQQDMNAATSIPNARLSKVEMNVLVSCVTHKIRSFQLDNYNISFHNNDGNCSSDWMDITYSFKNVDSKKYRCTSI
jgi:hypothetical protein